MFSFWLLKVLVLELKENGTKAFHSFILPECNIRYIIGH